MTGIELIAQERKEQIEKHNRPVQYDVKVNDQYQLSEARLKLKSLPEKETDWPTDLIGNQLRGTSDDNPEKLTPERVEKADNKLAYNDAIDDVLTAFEPLFKIAPKAGEIISITETMKKIYNDIEKLRKP